MCVGGGGGGWGGGGRWGVGGGDEVHSSKTEAPSTPAELVI